mmetsp:Transcript_18814/g.43757  ORF Transcript_18814/g.43757 Transcript_18814/m.43757 type:complete len:322 (+) Transcript_18814:81-1046(+)
MTCLLLHIVYSWRNVSEDVLECTSCKAVLVFLLDPKLHPASVKRIATIYRKKLCCGHQVTCPFFASNFVDDDDASPPLPFYMACVLEKDLVQLLEHGNPTELLLQRARTLLPIIIVKTATSDDDPQQQPILVSRKDPEMISLMETAVSIVLQQQQQQQDDNRTRLLCATQWALFGWSPCSEEEGVLECTMCLATASTMATTTTESTTTTTTNDEATGSSSPKRKRMRCHEEKGSLHPLDSHRYYCPFVCGFPRGSADDNDDKPIRQQESTPLWKVLAERIVATQTSSIITERTQEQGSVEASLNKTVRQFWEKSLVAVVEK